MTDFLNLSAEALDARNSLWTAMEICQQPRVWRAAQRNIADKRDEIDRFLQPLLAKTDLRTIFCGAGTSAFIGETLAPYLRHTLSRRFDAISTTDMVANPAQYLEPLPTLMVSFARSGDSPESVAAVNLADRLLEECHHLVLTCNPDGSLGLMSGGETGSGRQNKFCLLMPAETNDRGFAMTSSFSSMLVSGLVLFADDNKQFEAAVTAGEYILSQKIHEIESLARQPFNRLVVLGAGALSGIAREAALKCLELTAGRVVSLYDTPLGFRHGPKSVVDESTLVIHLYSSNPYTHQYEQDLYVELQKDSRTKLSIELSLNSLMPAQQAPARMDDVWLSLPCIVYCQVLAFFKAQALGVGADNPCPSGEVNRVVQGVNIHRYTEAS